MLQALAAPDWIGVAVLLASLLVGAWRGLVVEVVALLSWLAAFVLARWLAPDVAAGLPMVFSAEPLRYAAGFALVFVATLFVGGLVGFVVSRMLSAVGLGALNRMLGAGFGLVRGAVLILVATLVLGMTPLRQSQAWQSSVGLHWASSALALLKPLLPQDIGQYLPTN